MEISLKQKTISGVGWSTLGGFSVQGVQFVLSIVIARMVAPSEFGLIAMLGIFIAIAQTIVDSGFSNALIQKKHISDIDFSTVFVFNLIASIFFYLVLYFSANAIGDFYNEPELSILTKWVGLNILISSISIIQKTKLSIELNFKTQSIISLVSIIISGFIGIIMAYQKYGVWALVAQSLSNNLINSILLWIFAKWKVSIKFSITSFKTLFSFGSKILISALIHTIYINLYSLVIGKRYSATDVGYFNRASSIARFPSLNIVYFINRVIFPLQCQIQDDNERLSNLFANYLKIACYIIFPLMIALAVLAEPLILIILTEKWLPSATLILILCFAYMWDPVMVINVQILNVKGRSDYYLISEIIKKFCAILILIITIPYGIKVLALGLVLYSIIDIFIIVLYAKKVISTSYSSQFKNLYPIFLLSIATGLMMYVAIFSINSSILKLIIGGITGVSFYLLMSYFLKIDSFYLLKSYLVKPTE